MLAWTVHPLQAVSHGKTFTGALSTIVQLTATNGNRVSPRRFKGRFLTIEDQIQILTGNGRWEP
jgi:hypothetical protein